MYFKKPLLVALVAATLTLLPTMPALAATPTPTPTPTASANPALQAARDIKLAQGKGDHSVVLTWQPPKGVKTDGGQQYFVNTTVTLGAKKLSALTDTSTTKLKLTYNNLPAGAKLRSEVETLQRMASGKHDYSNTFTLPQLKPNPVRNATLIATGVQLKTTWQAPDDKAGTLVDAYRLTAYQVDLTNGSKKKAASTTLKNPKNLAYTFKKLKPQTNYYIFIEAHNSEGYSKTAQTNNAVTGANLTAPTSTPTATPSETATPLPTPSISSDDGSATTGPTPEPTVNPDVSQVAQESKDANKNIDATKNNLALMQGIVILVSVLFLLGAGYGVYRFIRRG